MVWGSLSLELGFRRITLARRPLSAPLTSEQQQVNRRVALELRGSGGPLDGRSARALSQVLGGGTLEDVHRPLSARSERRSIDVLFGDLERALQRGDLLAEELVPPPPLQEREALTPDAPPPAPRRAPAPEPLSPEPSLPPERVDQELQAETLRMAAEQGVPFCEECEKARRGAAVPTPATHAAPAPPGGGLG
ncbi:MAG TPA: hypothetical protein VER33_22260 [Polyangiaceae bacterium]|nr:hypothetical protein [Polyangiaceae bacterium]